LARILVVENFEFVEHLMMYFNKKSGHSQYHISYLLCPDEDVYFKS
jgi:hypothetical protein